MGNKRFSFGTFALSLTLPTWFKDFSLILILIETNQRNCSNQSFDTEFTSGKNSANWRPNLNSGIASNQSFNTEFTRAEIPGNRRPRKNRKPLDIKKSTENNKSQNPAASTIIPTRERSCERLFDHQKKIVAINQAVAATTISLAPCNITSWHLKNRLRFVLGNTCRDKIYDLRSL